MGSVSFVIGLVITSNLDISWQKTHLSFYIHIHSVVVFNGTFVSKLKGCVDSDRPSTDDSYGLLLWLLMVKAGWSYNYLLSHFPVNILTHCQNIAIGLDSWGSSRPYFIPGQAVHWKFALIAENTLIPDIRLLISIVIPRKYDCHIAVQMMLLSSSGKLPSDNRYEPCPDGYVGVVGNDYTCVFGWYACHLGCVLVYQQFLTCRDLDQITIDWI